MIIIVKIITCKRETCTELHHLDPLFCFVWQLHTGLSAAGSQLRAALAGSYCVLLFGAFVDRDQLVRDNK